MGTTAKGYPYPEGTDLVADGDDAIQALAQTIDTKLPYAMATGTRSMGNIKAGETKNFAVTFPSGRFAVAPVVTLGLNSGLPHEIFIGYSAATASGFTVNIFNGRSAAISSVNASWTATQFNAGAALFAGTLDTVEPDATVTCPTSGCGNQGVAIPIISTWTDEDGTVRPVDGVFCGVCNADITASLQATS